MYHLRAVIIDDSVVFRSYLIDAISSIPEVRVVGFASDGKTGIEKVRQYSPDIVTLDIEMPVLNGIETLQLLKKKFSSVTVIMVSSLTRSRSLETIKALEYGAFDFITKPDSISHSENKAELQCQFSKIISHLLSSVKKESKPFIISHEKKVVQTSSRLPEIIGIGVSTGGPKALSVLIPQLPATLNVPIVIVQHMPPIFTASLAESLAQKSKIPVAEAVNGDEVRPGKVYIAPGGYQMCITRSKNGISREILLTNDPAENFCKPSVDYLFRSLAKEYKSDAIGIILTGMGKDGTLGLSLMKKFGAKTIAQDEETSTVFGMSREAVQAGIVDKVLPIEAIADEIMNTLN